MCEAGNFLVFTVSNKQKSPETHYSITNVCLICSLTRDRQQGIIKLSKPYYVTTQNVITPSLSTTAILMLWRKVVMRHNSLAAGVAIVSFIFARYSLFDNIQMHCFQHGALQSPNTMVKQRLQCFEQVFKL